MVPSTSVVSGYMAKTYPRQFLELLLRVKLQIYLSERRKLFNFYKVLLIEVPGAYNRF